MDWTPLAGHILEAAAFALVLAAPLPLALRVLRGWRERLAEGPRGLVPLALIVLWTSLQVGLGLLLGIAGLLGRGPLLAAEALLLLGGAAAWLPGRRRRQGDGRGWRLGPGRPLDRVEASLLMLVALTGLAAVWVLLSKPTDNFDSLAYHLPVMARWVETHSLSVFGELGQVALYPSNWELLATMLVLPWGEDLTVGLPNLLAWVQLGLAVFLLARQLGVGTRRSLAAAALLLFVPDLLGRLPAIQPDIAVAAWFVGGLVFGLRWARRAATPDLALLLLSAAMLCGLKLSGPGYAVLLAGVVLVARWLDVRAGAGEPAAAGRSLRTAALLAPALLLLAATWYVRNWLVIGNPLGQVELRLAGVSIFPGELGRAELARTTLGALFEPGRAEHWTLLAKVGWDALGLPLVAMLLLAVPATVAILRGRAGLPRRRGLLLLALLAIAFLAYWNSPYSGDNGEHGWQLTPWIAVGLRYGYVWLALLAVLAAVGLRTVRLGAGWVLPVVVAAAVLALLLDLSPWVWAERAAVLVALLLAVGLHRPRRLGRVPKLVAAGLVCVGLTGAAWSARVERELQRFQVYGSYYSTMENEVGPRETVGFVNVPRIYPAAGHGWRRRLLPVDPRTTERDAWLARLRREGVDVVLLGHSTEKAADPALVTRVEAWVADPDSAFVMLHHYETLARDEGLYRLRPPGAAKADPDPDPDPERRTP